MNKIIHLVLFLSFISCGAPKNQSKQEPVQSTEQLKIDMDKILKLSGSNPLTVAMELTKTAKDYKSYDIFIELMDQELSIACEDTCIIERK